jgi:hypothetical protein
MNAETTGELFSSVFRRFSFSGCTELPAIDQTGSRIRLVAQHFTKLIGHLDSVKIRPQDPLKACHVIMMVIDFHHRRAAESSFGLRSTATDLRSQSQQLMTRFVFRTRTQQGGRS